MLISLETLDRIYGIGSKFKFVIAYLLFVISFRKIILFPSMEIALYNFRFLSRKNSVDYNILRPTFEPKTTQFMMKQQGKVFVDVGANIGRYTILLSDNFEKIIAFEPLKTNFNQLLANIELNEIANIEAIDRGLYNKKCTIAINYSDNDLVGASMISDFQDKHFKKQEFIQTIMFDSLNIDHIDLLKVDVEGVEFEFLEGAKNTLKITNPIVVIESLDYNRLVRVMSELGYKEVQDVIDLKSHNFLFIKKEGVTNEA